MLVADLIAALQGMPQDAEVVLLGDDCYTEAYAASVPDEATARLLFGRPCVLIS